MIKKILTFLRMRKKKTLLLSVVLFSVIAVTFTVVPSIANAGWTDCIPEKILGAIIIAIAAIFRLLFDLAILTAGLLVAVMDPKFLGHEITSFQPYYTAWASVRDIANMAIVLGFIFIGVATTLRIQEYSAQKKLPALIVVAILINFTPLFCGLIIDSSSIIAKNFIDRNEGITQTLKAQDASLTSQRNILRSLIENDECDIYINGGGGKRLNQSGKDGDWVLGAAGAWAYLKNSFTAGIYFGFSGIIFLILAAILAARYAMLILLFIISPLAFFCIVFPFSKKYFSSWLNNFLKWSFVGVTTLFCIWLGNIVFGASKGELFDVFIACIFLFIGFKLAMTSSGIGAAFVTGALGAAGGFALGATKSISGKTLGAAGGVGSTLAGKLPFADTISNAASRISGGGARALESVGLAKPGTFAGKQAAKVNTAQKRMDNMSSEEIAKSVQRRGANRDDVAGGMKVLATRGDLGKVDSKNLPSLVNKATSRGVDRDVFTKSEPTVGASNKEIKQERRQVYEQVRRTGQDLSGKQIVGRSAQKKYAKTAGESMAQEKAIGKALQGRSPQFIRENIKPATLSNYSVFKALDTRAIKEIKDKGSAEQIEALEKYTDSRTDQFKKWKGDLVAAQTKQNDLVQKAFTGAATTKEVEKAKKEFEQLSRKNLTLNE